MFINDVSDERDGIPIGPKVIKNIEITSVIIGIWIPCGQEILLSRNWHISSRGIKIKWFKLQTWVLKKYIKTYRFCELSDFDLMVTDAPTA